MPTKKVATKKTAKPAPKPTGNVGGPNKRAVKDAATGLPKKTTPSKTKEADAEVLNYDKEHKTTSKKSKPGAKPKAKPKPKR